MEIDGIEITKYCGYCDYMVSIESEVCPNCKNILKSDIIVADEFINLTFGETKEKINDAFFRLEAFMDNRIQTYQHFSFISAFGKLFFDLKKPENFTDKNCKLMGEYWKLCSQIYYDFEKGNYKNRNASSNEDFDNDCGGEIAILADDNDGDFLFLLTPDEIAESERKISISDILKKETVQIQQVNISDIRNNNPDTSEICNVPNTNDIFRKNFNICDEIKRSYYSMVPQPSERPNNYVGNLWEHNDPFRVRIYGAYPLMNNWEMLECMMENNQEAHGYYKHFTKEKVFTSLKDYAKGFQIGFDNFFNDVMKERFVTELDKEEKKQAIIDYLSSLPDTGAFSQRINGNDNDIFSGWYNDGMEGGKHYFAWYYLLANHRLFERYFKERVESHKDNNEENGQSTIIDFTENNFNPNLKSVQDVTTFFTKELKPFAKETMINEFLYSAFQLCQVPQQKFSFQELNYKKKKIMRVFNKFYNECGKIQSEAAKYAGILGDYFIGFETENVRTNWTK
jgi:hypothetical protein